jgi:hypothetical protein
MHQVAQAFSLEVKHRENVEAYCQWYYQVAAENQRDLKRMQSELNLLAWFNRHPA